MRDSTEATVKRVCADGRPEEKAKKPTQRAKEETQFLSLYTLSLEVLSLSFFVSLAVRLGDETVKFQQVTHMPQPPLHQPRLSLQTTFRVIVFLLPFRFSISLSPLARVTYARNFFF